MNCCRKKKRKPVPAPAPGAEAPGRARKRMSRRAASCQCPAGKKRVQEGAATAGKTGARSPGRGSPGSPAERKSRLSRPPCGRGKEQRERGFRPGACKRCGPAASSAQAAPSALPSAAGAGKAAFRAVRLRNGPSARRDKAGRFRRRPCTGRGGPGKSPEKNVAPRGPCKDTARGRRRRSRPSWAGRPCFPGPCAPTSYP